MAQISKRWIKPETEDKITQLFEECLVACSSKDATKNFIDDILTPTEKVVLSKRLAIAFLLDKGYGYETIKSLLKVSFATIGMVSVNLKLKGSGLRKIFEKVKRNRQVKSTLEDIANAFIDLAREGKGGNWKEVKKDKHYRELQKKSPL